MSSTNYANCMSLIVDEVHKLFDQCQCPNDIMAKTTEILLALKGLQDEPQTPPEWAIPEPEPLVQQPEPKPEPVDQQPEPVRQQPKQVVWPLPPVQEQEKDEEDEDEYEEEEEEEEEENIPKKRVIGQCYKCDKKIDDDKK
jgi:hypothetical protein